MQQAVLLLQENDIIKCDSKANQCRARTARNVEKESMGWLPMQNVRFSGFIQTAAVLVIQSPSK